MDDGVKEKIRRQGWRQGVLAAADIADGFNSMTTHEFRLGDCVALKLNAVIREFPRRNKKKLQTPEAALTQGMAVALAEMHRLHGDSTGVCEVAKAAGITLAEAKEAGTDAYDWKELKKAGVK